MSDNEFVLGNSTEVPPDMEPFFDGIPDLVVAIYNMALSPITLIGNLLLAFVLCRDPLKLFLHPSCYLLLTMTLANVITGLGAHPLIASAHMILYLGKGLEYLESLAMAAGTVALISLNISFFMVHALAFDNYIAVSRPLRHKRLISRFRVRIWIVFTVVYTLALASLPYLGVPVDLVYSIDLFLNSTLNSILLLISYLFLLKAFRAKAKQSIRLRNQTINQTQAESKSQMAAFSKKFEKLFYIFVFLFTVPAILLTIIGYLKLYCSICTENDTAIIVKMVINNLIFLKPAVDPFVFGWRIPKYRCSLKKTLSKPAGKLTRSIERGGMSSISLSTNKKGFYDLSSKTFENSIDTSQF